MTPFSRAPGRSRRPRTLFVAGALALAVVGAGCVPAPPPPPPGDVCDPPPTSTAAAVSVMGPCSRLTVEQIATWFEKNTASPYRASVPLRELIGLFLEEGRTERVRGDIAFIQSIVETGWFAFSGRVPPSANNFSGYGATDSTTDYGVFIDARHGVRTQIQHLRAYADPTFTTCTQPPLSNPCVTPRFGYVVPKGKAPTWNQFGNGNWATDSLYAYKIVGSGSDPIKGLYTKLLESYGLALA